MLKCPKCGSGLMICVATVGQWSRKIIELISSEGDRLNLKSKLSQYVSFAKIMAAGNEVPELEIVAYESEDINILFEFMFNGKGQTNGKK